MTIRVLIPTPLRQYIGNREMVELDGITIKDVLEHLTESNDSLRRHLLDKEGKLRNFVNIYVNEDNIRYLQGEFTRLKDGDTVTIIPAIAGGFTGTARQLSQPDNGERIVTSHLLHERP